MDHGLLWEAMGEDEAVCIALESQTEHDEVIM